MNLSRKWLHEFVRPDVSDKELADALTLSGSKAEGFSRPGDELKNVVVGRIASIERMENSDKLFVCQIDAGGQTIQIVTGAQNVTAGDFVPVALDGAVLAGGVTIQAGKLRGADSLGMLCSVKELGLTIHDFPYAIEDGIFILQHDPDLAAANLTPGQDIVPVLGLDDTVVEFEITSNRPDCLSILGMARETAATFALPFTPPAPSVRGSGGSVAELLDIEIEDANLCRRYTARMVKNVKIAPSPKWMRDRLRACGVRPINNIVDITNYVMLEYGQPMHAFDFSCVQGGKLVIRTAREGETIQTLDGNDRTLTPAMLCICDESRPVGVAGVMGGANSEIVGDTAMVVFESANFNGTSVRRTAAALGMRTDASGRFEKGLDPMNTLPAVQRACELVELLGCGEVVDGVLDVIAADTAPVTLALAPEKINALLGTEISAGDMAEMLTRLGFTVEGETVTVPSWRPDVAHFSDLAEEVARLHGYDAIPSTLMRGETTRGGYSAKQKAEQVVGSLCRGMGYSEIITYSFFSPAAYDKIRLPADSPLRRSVTILNPLGEDTSLMRTTALPSLLEILARNHSYRNPSARLYELATVYRPGSGPLAEESVTLSLGAYGSGADFFSLKGEVEALLARMNVADVRFTADTGNPSFHPGRCAAVTAGGTVLGVVGQIHPSVCEHYDLECDAFAAQLDMNALCAARGGEVKYRPLPRFPEVTRDIAVVCDSTVTAGDLTDCIHAGSGGLLRGAELFDVYTGAPIPAGKKSVAFALKLRADDRTLTDAEADAEVSGILSCLEARLGAVLR